MSAPDPATEVLRVYPSRTLDGGWWCPVYGDFQPPEGWELLPANDTIRKGGVVVTEDSLAAIQSDVDVVVEATGLPEAGFWRGEQELPERWRRALS